jgi:polysaccharide pyruvyl transferase WcaK-like protein
MSTVPAVAIDSESASRRYVFISPCGWGNLGDAAIIDSLIAGIQSRVFDAQVVGHTLHWLDTTTRHGVESHPLTSFPLPFYPLLPADANETYELPRFDGSTARSTGNGNSPTEHFGIVASVRRRLKRRRRVLSFGCAMVGLARARHERHALRELRQQLAGTEMIIVAGGGQLDALFGGVFGQPYVLWRWNRLARQVGAKFVVLAVGTGTLDVVDRLVVRQAIRRA